MRVRKPSDQYQRMKGRMNDMMKTSDENVTGTSACVVCVYAPAYTHEPKRDAVAFIGRYPVATTSSCESSKRREGRSARRWRDEDERTRRKKREEGRGGGYKLTDMITCQYPGISIRSIWKHFQQLPNTWGIHRRYACLEREGVGIRSPLHFAKRKPPPLHIDPPIPVQHP